VSGGSAPVRPVQLAAVQLCSSDDRTANRHAVSLGVRDAVSRGAEVVCLPEMWPFIGSDADKVAGAEALDGPSVSFLQELSVELGIWMFAGSFAERSDVPGRVYNTSPVLNPAGELVGVYRKIHLFDIDIAGGPSFLESATVAPGGDLVVVDSPLGRVGLSVCYDLRFPTLYERLREQGAEVLMVPAAFTAHTGRAHWELLLRARAVEQQCWVVAADQGGHHNPRRESYGNSMIVDPWGEVQARLQTLPDVAIATVDPARTAKVRRELPCLDHRRSI
jgi:deaminated glutathione amidase